MNKVNVVNKFKCLYGQLREKEKTRFVYMLTDQINIQCFLQIERFIGNVPTEINKLKVFSEFSLFKQ